jgi:hypothetical protein
MGCQLELMEFEQFEHVVSDEEGRLQFLQPCRV